MASESISEHIISKNFLGKHAPYLANLRMYTYTSDTHITLLLKILATGLCPKICNLHYHCRSVQVLNISDDVSASLHLNLWALIRLSFEA